MPRKVFKKVNRLRTPRAELRVVHEPVFRSRIEPDKKKYIRPAKLQIKSELIDGLARYGF
jgi:stalled ribosome alternative rescue factor ArfA